MVIDKSYFKGGKLFIPNITSNASVTGNVPTASADIESYIARYEEDLLLHALGLENYEALKAAIENDAAFAEPENEKWKDLVNGKTYTFEGVQVKWAGLRTMEGELKTSLIADYVFYHYLIDDFQHYSTVGIQKEKAKNAEPQSPNLKLTQVWRDFIHKYQFGAELSPVVVHTPSGSYQDYYSASMNVKRSLWQFLSDNDQYGDFSFKVYENRNRFGL